MNRAEAAPEIAAAKACDSWCRFDVLTNVRARACYRGT
jgi:hypothetical protein